MVETWARAHHIWESLAWLPEFRGLKAFFLSKIDGILRQSSKYSSGIKKLSPQSESVI